MPSEGEQKTEQDSTNKKKHKTDPDWIKQERKTLRPQHLQERECDKAGIRNISPENNSNQASAVKE